MSYGEQMSALIVSALVRGSRLHDSRKFIKTEKRHGRDFLASELTRKLIINEFMPGGCHLEGIHVLPGFIATDIETGEVTNLGRGGSDYTASLVCAALDGECLEIWTDVDGFMTADPKVIPTAYTISTLSYHEAMELCNFGAKVIYPPTIYPVCVKHIPILVKNTFAPDAPARWSATSLTTTQSPSRASRASAAHRSSPSPDSRWLA